MIKMSLSEMATLLACQQPTQDVTFHGVSHDTRTLTPGNLYVAIQGEQFDGHQFVPDAFQKGASAALVSHPVDAIHPQLIVDQPLEALGKLSAAWRQRFTLPLIAVTGSNGKTTLKNMIASILRAACDNTSNSVLATEGNFNNNIGLPLTLLRLDANHRYGVIEMGMNHFGEIAYLTRLTQPAVAVITNAAESHLEGLKTIAGVAQAKGEIFQGLSANGIAVLNRDDAHFDYWTQLIPNHSYLTFGLNHPADVTAIHTEEPHLTLQTPKGNITLKLPLLGRHNVMNALAATAATLAVGIHLTAIQRGLEQVIPAPGRMRPYLLDNGVRIIDDTYNANPFSLQAAVTTLAALQGTKIVVLGDMKELGPDAKEMHYNSGIKMRSLGIDYLLTYGNLSAAASEGFGQGATHFSEREPLLAALKPLLTRNATILIKGSRSMKMEKILAELIPEAEFTHAH